MQAGPLATETKPGAILRGILEERRAVLVPGAGNALAARVIEDLGFEALYLSGAGLTNTMLGLPDQAFISLAELAEQTALIREITSLPLIVDADTGFGNELNTWHTVKRLARAGADAIQIEDQLSPKRCGHFSGKAVIELSEMLGKVKAALDARSSADMLVIARTDARAVHGFEAAIERAAAMIEAGADVTFVEAPVGIEEIERIPRCLAAPQLLNIVIGGRTAAIEHERLCQMGFAMVLYANAALQGAVLGMQRALGELKATGRLDERADLLASFAERQRLVGKPGLDAMAERYAALRPQRPGQ